MDITLSSRLSNDKSLLLPHPRSNKQRRPPVFIAVQCRATKLVSENETANFYKVLSVSPDNVNVAEIKKAYRTMALRYHPDVCHPSKKEESTRMFVQLQAAYKTLSDPVLRHDYDCELDLRSFGQTYKRDIGDQHRRSKWQDQILELKRRSNYGMAQKEGSWGSRLRAQKVQKK